MADLTIDIALDKSKAKAGATQFRQDMATLNKGVVGDAKGAYAEDSAAFKAALDAKRQVVANMAEGQMRVARRVHENEMINVQSLKRARGSAADDSIRNYQRIGVAARKAAAESAGGFEKAGGAVEKMASTLSSVTSLMGTALSAKALVDMGNSIQGVMHAAVMEGEKELENLRQLKNELIEIAAMTGGKEGPSDAEVDKHIKIRQASGLDRGEARALSMELHGAAESTVGVNISEKDLKKVEPMVARLAETSVEGPDAAGQVGKLTGLIAQGGPTDAAKLLGMTAHTLKVLSEGVGDNATLIKQQAKVMGAYTDEEGKALFNSPVELASHIAAASKVNPEQAADTVESTARVLTGATEKWAPLLGKAGIGEHDSYTERSRKLFAHLEQVEASGRQVGAYLSEEGVDSHGKRNLLSMYKYRKSTEESLAKNARVMTGQGAANEIEAKYRASNHFRTDIERANKDAAKIRNAMNLQYAEEIKLQAETKLENKGMGESSPAGALEAQRIGMFASNSGVTLPEGMTAPDLGRKIMVEEEMNRIVEARGQKVPGRPAASLQKNLVTPEQVGWLVSGADTGAYSTVGLEHELTQRVGPARPGDDGSVRVAPPMKGQHRLGEDPKRDGAIGRMFGAGNVGVNGPNGAKAVAPQVNAANALLPVLNQIQANTAKAVQPPKVPPAPLVGPPRVQRR